MKRSDWMEGLLLAEKYVKYMDFDEVLEYFNRGKSWNLMSKEKQEGFDDYLKYFKEVLK